MKTIKKFFQQLIPQDEQKEPEQPEVTVENAGESTTTDYQSDDSGSSEHEDSLSIENNESSEATEPIVKPLLSDNKPFVKLAGECAELMTEFEGYSDRMETNEGKMMAEMVVKRLQEVLERAGLERIDNEMEFSILRHSPVPMQLVQEGAPIVQTRFPGLALGNRVYRKAVVFVDQSDKKQNLDQHEM